MSPYKTLMYTVSKSWTHYCLCSHWVLLQETILPPQGNITDDLYILPVHFHPVQKHFQFLDLILCKIYYTHTPLLVYSQPAFLDFGLCFNVAFLVAHSLQVVKNPPVMQEMRVWSPGMGRSPGEGNGNLLQYSCLGNSMDRGAWWATVHGVTKSWTWPSKHAAAASRFNVYYHISCIFQ